MDSDDPASYPPISSVSVSCNLWWFCPSIVELTGCLSGKFLLRNGLTTNYDSLSQCPRWSVAGLIHRSARLLPLTAVDSKFFTRVVTHGVWHWYPQSKKLKCTEVYRYTVHFGTEVSCGRVSVLSSLDSQHIVSHRASPLGYIVISHHHYHHYHHHHHHDDSSQQQYQSRPWHIRHAEHVL